MKRPADHDAIDGRMEIVRDAVVAAKAAPSVIVITSATERDGKGALAEGLARSLVLAGRRVLLVDANPGPASLTRGSAPRLSAEPEFDILAFAVAARSGAPGALSLTGPEIAATCTPKAAAAAFNRFRAAYDFTIVDAATPERGIAMVTLADAADRVLVAVRFGRRATRGDRSLIDLLESGGGASVLGVVTMHRRTIEAFGAREPPPLGPFPFTTFVWAGGMRAAPG
jgi:cellulose biosynthesis protein BcsQ